MKASIFRDERWPDYVLIFESTKGLREPVEIPDDLREEYVRVTTNYEVLQGKLEALYVKARSRG